MKTCPTCRSNYPIDFSLCPRDGTPLVVAGVWLEGTVVRGKYRILAKVGQGGMGTVYKALHLRFAEVRALKVLSAQLASDAAFVQRFEREAVLTRKLQHPNAVRIDDIDESEDGRPFIVMEFIEGRSLKQLIAQEGPLGFARTGVIIKQVAAALDAAHRLGVVHRDIKPDNIVLMAVDPPGASGPHQAHHDFAKVLDFGIAKVKESTHLTQTGVVIGTPQYMSPEQAMGKRGDDIDARSDIYSLGNVMYEMLTGQLPFKADTTLELLLAHMQAAPPPIRTLRPDLLIPEAIAHVVMRCLEKKRELRPAGAQQLIEELDQAEKEFAEELAPTVRLAVKVPTPEPLTSLTPEPRVVVDHSPPTRPKPRVVVRSPPPAPLKPEEPQIRPVTPPDPNIRVIEKRGSLSLFRPSRSIPALTFVGLLFLGAYYFESRPSPTPINPPTPIKTTPVQPTRGGEVSRYAPIQPSRPITHERGPEAKTEPALKNPAVNVKEVQAALTEGDAFYQDGDYDKADAAYQHGLTLDPTNADLLHKVEKSKNAKAAEGTVNQ